MDVEPVEWSPQDGANPTPDAPDVPTPAAAPKGRRGQKPKGKVKGATKSPPVPSTDGGQSAPASTTGTTNPAPNPTTTPAPTSLPATLSTVQGLAPLARRETSIEIEVTPAASTETSTPLYQRKRPQKRLSNTSSTEDGQDLATRRLVVMERMAFVVTQEDEECDLWGKMIVKKVKHIEDDMLREDFMQHVSSLAVQAVKGKWSTNNLVQYSRVGDPQSPLIAINTVFSQGNVAMPMHADTRPTSVRPRAGTSEEYVLHNMDTLVFKPIHREEGTGL